MDSEKNTVSMEISTGEEGVQKSDVQMPNAQCHGSSDGIPLVQCSTEHSSPPVSKTVVTGSVGMPSISHSRKVKIRKQLLDMLGDSCILLEKANVLEKQSRLLLEDNCI